MPGQFVKQVSGLRVPYSGGWHPVVDGIFHLSSSKSASVQFSLAQVRFLSTSGASSSALNGTVTMKLSLFGPRNGQVLHADLTNTFNDNLLQSWVLNIAATPPTLEPGHYLATAAFAFSSTSGSAVELFAERAAIAVATL